jgi:hypothetical protein
LGGGALAVRSLTLTSRYWYGILLSSRAIQTRCSMDQIHRSSKMVTVPI